MKTFTTDTLYKTRAIGDHNCIWRFFVVKRTAKTVTLQSGEGETIRTKVPIDQDGNEMAFPFGRYSMAPTLRAI